MPHPFLSRFAISLIVLTTAQATLAELRIPAATAYLEPNSRSVRVSEDRGITRWTNPETKILWFGQFKSTGKLQVAVELQTNGRENPPLQLTLGEETRSAKFTKTDDDLVRADFGTFTIKKAGYRRFTLHSEKPSGAIKTLVLDGPAIKEAHFNLKPRRNSASVHLAYPVPKDTKVSAFYCEMTGIEEPLWTYYMACGWHRGYFGMQVNSPTERRIIFSVWDSGNEAIDRDKVSQEDRVQLVEKGDGVYSGDFGNEGTGGHSHLKYWWKTGERQRFLVTAEPVSETHTIFAGYYFHPDSRRWMLISSWKAPKEGKYLRGLYSFSENFAGRNGHALRKAAL